MDNAESLNNPAFLEAHIMDLLHLEASPKEVLSLITEERDRIINMANGVPVTEANPNKETFEEKLERMLILIKHYFEISPEAAQAFYLRMKRD